MEKFWILILVAFFVINSRDKAEAVQMNELEELPLQTFDELFVDEWLDKNKAEDFKMLAPTNFGQNVHCQINRQNTPLGQIEPNSADQLGQIEPNSTDQLEQIQPNSTDQLGQIQPNSPDQLGEIVPNSTDQNPPLTESDHFENAKDEEMTSNEKHKTVAKELGLSFRTIYNWKSELGQTEPNQKYAQSEQKELMKGYYEIKDKNPKIRDEDIAKMFKIGRATLVRYSVEENAAANVQEIEKSNLAGSI
uniref:Uncharacterized protein n=1 Tax=Globodera rostochiensis TaxID=31243 RepID=A0A914H8L3_GLORO